MVLVSVSIHEARVSSTFFGGLKASRRWKLKKIIILENIVSNELSLVFSKIVSKGLCWDKVWGISIFPSYTPIRGIYRKSLLMDELTGFAWLPRSKKITPPLRGYRILSKAISTSWNCQDKMLTFVADNNKQRGILFVEKWEVTIIHHVIVKQHQFNHVQVYLRVSSLTLN